jgi:hypothetical protein
MLTAVKGCAHLTTLVYLTLLNKLKKYSLHFGAPSSVVVKALYYNFYFGVLHPVAGALSRLSEEPSFATTVQGKKDILIPPKLQQKKNKPNIPIKN